VTPRVLAGLIAAALLLALAPVARAADPPPAISAPSALVVESSTADVAYARQPDRRRSIASATKLMTALLTLEKSRPSTVYRAVRYRALPAESQIELRPGEKMTVADLLRGLLIESANDAAATLATRIGGSESAFVRAMNTRARQLGLKNTHYANPIGLDDPGNYSTARDLVRLTLRARAFDFFRRTVAREQVTLHSGDHPRTLENRNGLVKLPQVNGVKTGHTQQAGYVLVGSATRRGVTVLSAVLGDPGEAERDADTLALLRYGLGRYARSVPVRRGHTYATARLRDRGDDHVDLVAARTVARTVRHGEPARTHVVDTPAVVDGPLPAGARVGTVEVRWRGHVVARVPLVTRTAVSGAGFFDKVDNWIGRTLLVLALATVALGSLQLALLRRRARRRRAVQRGGTEVA
jgi:D-alanyl-D-alanine carboxypeptidase (penicillin-binding protein 5/6)